MSKIGVCPKCHERRWLGGKHGVCKPCAYPVGHCEKCNHLGKLYVCTLCYCCYQHKRVAIHVASAAENFKPKTDYNGYLFRLYLTYIKRYRLCYHHIPQTKKLSSILETDEWATIKSWRDIYTLEKKYKLYHRNNKNYGSVVKKIGYMLEELGVLSPKDDDHLYSLEHAINLFESPLKDHICHYSQWLTKSKRTETTAINTIRHIFLFDQWLKTVYPEFSYFSASEQKLSEYLVHMGHSYKYSSVRTGFYSIRRFYDLLLHRKQVLYNPAAGMPMGNTHNKLVVISNHMLTLVINFIKSKQSPSEEAFILMLMIYFAMTTEDILNARVSIENETLKIILRQKKRSYGRHYFNREQVLTIPQAPDWLKSLTDRFVQDWQKHYKNITKTYDNPFLLLPKHTRFCRAVTHTSFIKKIYAITKKITGIEIPPKVLRQTSGAMYSRKGDSAILSKLGWSPDFAFHYTWLPQEIYSKQKTQLPL